MRKIFALLLALGLALVSPAFADDTPYLAKDQIDLTHLIPPPPVPGTADQQRDLAMVLQIRANASEADRARAIADAEISIYRFADVLGPKFRERRLPTTTAFFKRVLESIGPFIGAGKAYWHHDRPFVMDTNVASPQDMIEGVCNSKAGQAGSAATAICLNGVSFSYPSGHSTFGTTVAILLGDMVPEKRDQLLARGRLYGESRIVNGVHFFTDVEAGRIEGTVLVALMMENPQFRADLADARAELRKQLGLPPSP